MVAGEEGCGKLQIVIFFLVGMGGPSILNDQLFDDALALVLLRLRAW